MLDCPTGVLLARAASLQGGWGEVQSLPITAKPKLDSVREAFHVDELRKGDKFEEFRFEVQANGLFGLSLIMPTLKIVTSPCFLSLFEFS